MNHETDSRTVTIEPTLLVTVEPLYVGLEDAGRMFGISGSKFRDMYKAGKCPIPVRIQDIKRNVWSVEELRAWAQAGFPIREKWEKIKELS